MPAPLAMRIQPGDDPAHPVFVGKEVARTAPHSGRGLPPRAEGAFSRPGYRGAGPGSRGTKTISTRRW
jgi:predicted GNAT family acetyltransferase